MYVYRGGRREPWECAAREAREEAGITLCYANADVAVHVHEDGIAVLDGGCRVAGSSGEQVLAVGGALRDGEPKSVLFLAEADERSQPNGEVYRLVKFTLALVVETVNCPPDFGQLEADSHLADRRADYAAAAAYRQNLRTLQREPSRRSGGR